ncbi:hypothetical protein D3C78_554020 [compost metagenome]
MQFVQHLSRRQAIRCGFRVGNRQVLELVFLQHIALAIDIVILGRPQRQGADGVGEARALDRVAFFFEFFRRAVIGGEEHLERRAVLDLRIELAGSAIGGNQRVAGVFLEVLGNRLDRCGEVGGNSHLYLIGPGAVQGHEGGQGGQGKTRCALTHEKQLHRLRGIRYIGEYIANAWPTGSTASAFELGEGVFSQCARQFTGRQGLAQA